KSNAPPMLPSVHTYTDDALGTLDAVGVSHAISSGRISPAEARQAALARAEGVDSRLRAIAHIDYRTSECRDPEFKDPARTDPLAGVPTFVKDNTHVAGLPARSGSAAVPATPANADAAATRTVRATGLSILGMS